VHRDFAMPRKLIPTAMAARTMASSALKEPLLGKETPTHVTVHTGGADDEKDEAETNVGNVIMTSLVCIVAAGACKLVWCDVRRALSRCICVFGSLVSLTIGAYFNL
jgi:hypothetical protein